MDKQIDINLLIIRLFSGEATPNEKEVIATWLNQSAENKKLYSDLQEIWLSSGIENNTDQYHLEEAIRTFKSKIRKENQQKKTAINFRLILTWAAILVLILALPFSYYLGIRSTARQNSMTTISCAFGDRTSIVLPDSTRVWLNSGSSVSFNPDFNQRTRKVILDGEAFFAVSKDRNHPFHVFANQIDIQVLGTQFNVKAYSGEHTISTTLVEGSLQVFSKTEKIRIKPFEKMVYNKLDQKMELQALNDISPDTEWKDGRLIFRNQSLEELEPILERWFDVDIIFADEQVKKKRFTGILERESILEALSYFDLSNLVECQIQGNKIIIKSEK